jgi:hypothetical protein
LALGIVAVVVILLARAPAAHAYTSYWCGYLRYSGQHCVDTSGNHSWMLVQNTYYSFSGLPYLCVSAYTKAGNYKQPRKGDGCGRNSNNYYDCFQPSPTSIAHISWGNYTGVQHTINGFANTNATACVGYS